LGCAKRMENNQMQDAGRVQEQMDEMVLRAQMRASVTKDHKKIATDRKAVAERELMKFRFMHEVFTMGEQILIQRRSQLTQADPVPGKAVFDGLEDAIQNLQGLQKQAQDAITRSDGAFQALSAFEQTLEQEAVEATARARGIEAQSQKAIAVAETRPSEASETAQEPLEPRGIPGFLERIEQLQEPEDSAKEPISAPKKTTS